MNSKYFPQIVILFVFMIPIAYGLDPTEYINEFSEPGESCEIVDVLTYQILSPTFFDGDHYSTTIQIFYLCTVEEQSTAIIYDIYNTEFSDKRYISELVDLNYIKYNLQNNQITEQHFISKGVDVCSYFSDDTLKEESVNLATSAAEKAAPMMNPKTAKEVTSNIQLGRNLNLIGKLNPTNFIASVGCSYKNDKVKDAVESLAICNGYLTNIRNSIARNGYVSELKSCVVNAKATLKIYLDSTLGQAIDTVNQAGNVVDALLIKPLKNLVTGLASGSNNYELPDFNVEKTERDVAQDIYYSLSASEIYFQNPKNSEIADKHIKRIELKLSQSNQKNTEINARYEFTRSIKPSIFEVAITDIFFEPNYNLSEAKESLNNAKKEITIGKNNYYLNKFNSALNVWDLAGKDLDNADFIFTRENTIKRNFDKRWYFTLIIPVVAVSLTIYVLRRRSNYL